MTLIDLKKQLTASTLPADFIILTNKDNKFLSRQYLAAINRLAGSGLRVIKSIYEPSQSSIALLTDTEDTFNVLYTDTFDERADDYSRFENTVVVCEQVDKSIAEIVEKYVINLPKLEEWQIYDFAKTICPFADEDDIKWLIKATDENIERVVNELEKVALFSKEEQKAIFSAIRFDPQTDLFKADLFSIVNALVDGNNLILLDFLRHDGHELIEPVVLANRTFNSLKNIVLISQNPTLTASDCGVSIGQYRFIKSAYYSLDIEAVRQKLKFLSNFDLSLKTSKLDMSKRDMLSYLINNLAYKIKK